MTSVWNYTENKKIFGEFVTTRIPVREPLLTVDAYTGLILGSETARIAHARAEKRSELRIGAGAIVVAVLCTVGGFLLFRASSPDDDLRWISGALDRLATTGLVTSAISFLTYWFRRQELVNTPVIKWE